MSHSPAVVVGSLRTCRPRVILWHHAVTFLLLQIPLKHPSLGVYTCYVSETNVGHQQHLSFAAPWHGVFGKISTGTAASCACRLPACTAAAELSPAIPSPPQFLSCRMG